MILGSLESFVNDIIEVFNSKEYYDSKNKPVKIDANSDVKIYEDDFSDPSDFRTDYAIMMVDQIPFEIGDLKQYTEYDVLNRVFDIADALELKEKKEIEESFETDKNDISVKNNYPALLVALDSEKDAELTYRTLIEVEESSDSPNKEVIDLLKKILDDELEHIALLSAMSAKNTSEFVADDSQEEFDDIVEKI